MEAERRRISLRPPSPDAWRELWNEIRTSASKAPVPVSISKVYQFDAEKLDFEMTGMLREQFLKIFSLAQPGFLSRYEPELNALLEFFIWRFSIWVDRPTPGNALMNLRFRDERNMSKLAVSGKVRTGLEGPPLSSSQKLFHLLTLVGGRYFWARLQMISAFQRWGEESRSSWPRRAWTLLQKAEGVYKVGCFINLLVFLRTGKYRNIVERVLRTRLVYRKPNMNRAVSFEYMNRQLVWHEFSELLLLVLPLLNVFSLKKVFSLSPSSGDPSRGSNEDACPICEACPITVPYVAVPCGHRHCYFCISTRCIASSRYRCLRCNSPVSAVKRHHPKLELSI